MLVQLESDKDDDVVNTECNIEIRIRVISYRDRIRALSVGVRIRVISDRVRIRLSQIGGAFTAQLPAGNCEPSFT